MSDAVIFYNSLTWMSNDELQEFEKELYRSLKNETSKYIKFIKYNYDPDLEYLFKDDQEDIFINLLTVRDYMFRENIEKPDRFLAKFLLTVLLFKTKKGY